MEWLIEPQDKVKTQWTGDGILAMCGRQPLKFPSEVCTVIDVHNSFPLCVWLHSKWIAREAVFLPLPQDELDCLCNKYWLEHRNHMFWASELKGLGVMVRSRLSNRLRSCSLAPTEWPMKEVAILGSGSCHVSWLTYSICYHLGPKVRNPPWTSAQMQLEGTWTRGITWAVPFAL